MRIAEVRSQTTEDLRKELEASYVELMNLRSQWAMRQLANYQEIKKVHKKIARVQTVLRARQLGIE